MTIFLLAGRTGGPLIPLLALSKSLPEFNPVIIGVKNGFETKLAQQQKFEIKYLPEAKLNLLSFKNQNLSQIILGILDLIKTLFLLGFSFCQCIYLLLKYKPKGVLSSGSFLAVPMIFAAAILKFFRLISTKIIIHQQDPLPGLANKLTIGFADLKSCVFEYTKINFNKFKDCQIIPNPIDTQKFDQAKIESIENEQLREFFLVQTALLVEESAAIPLEVFKKIVSDQKPPRQDLDPSTKSIINKPIFLIFGGGSGAKVINDWVSSNLDQLLEHFRIIHLTGILQEESPMPLAEDSTKEVWQKLSSKITPELSELDPVSKSIKKDYLSLPSLIQDMPAALKFSDVILCRAGLGSITELQYLNKTAFLVPIPNSHQELNAELMKDRFTILEQANISDWINVINAQILTKMGKNTSFIDDFSTKNATQKELEAFCNQLKILLVKSL